mmetsp:Transcript_19050/g.29745  ORF Transcript_19050/g.29745 Transcript_19050/m.29745 type:complete len:139 (+) Transcript_19050:434-850(+)
MVRIVWRFSLRSYRHHRAAIELRGCASQHSSILLVQADKLHSRVLCEAVMEMYVGERPVGPQIKINLEEGYKRAGGGELGAMDLPPGITAAAALLGQAEVALPVCKSNRHLRGFHWTCRMQKPARSLRKLYIIHIPLQ